MKEVRYIIVSEEMVWLYYYDEYKSKHFKELLRKEAREFIKELQATTNS
ncbi:hypothetical protein [Dyadobacter bucti]|nr:hypothetical protein [Dyadobacter bucti]